MPRLFGTNGVRGVANQDLGPDLAMRLGRAVATWLPPGATVALARDARTSGPMLEAAAAAGLLASGARVTRLGVCPTPAAQLYVKTHGEVAAGLVVTASHNPPEFNGLKLVAGDGTEASREEEAQVEALFASQSFRATPWDGLPDLADDAAANDDYVQAILSRVDGDAIRRKAFHVVADTGGGPGGLTTIPLLRRLGCRVTALHEDLDGAFRGRKSEPTPDNLLRLIETVKAEGADLGLAHDGDADRCIFVDENATWISGDQSFALLAGDAVRRRQGGTVVTPVATSSLLAEVVEAAGGRVVATAVGSPIVAREMLRVDAVLGGEENGGVIFPEHQHCRDAAMTAACMLELLAREGRPLGRLVADLPRYHQAKLKFPVPAAVKDELLGRLRAWVAQAHPGARVDETDGLKVILDEGWVLIRPSGTEPIYRVFAESKDASWPKAAAQRFVEAGRSLAAAVTA